jgi:hypothetical protein
MEENSRCLFGMGEGNEGEERIVFPFAKKASVERTEGSPGEVMSQS